MTSYSIKTLNLNLNSAEALGLNFAETQGEFIIFVEYSDTGEAGDAKIFLLAKPFSDSSSVSDVSDILLGKALSETITVSDDFHRQLTTIRTANNTASVTGAGQALMQSYMTDFSYFGGDFVGVSRTF